MNLTVLYGIAASLAFTCVCFAAYWMTLVQQKRALRRQMAKELCRPTHHVGAWLISVRAGAAESLADEVKGLSKRSEPPESIIRVLRSAGGVVVEHLPGPPAELGEHAHTWLHKMAGRIDHDIVSKLLGIGSRSIVVLAYASKEQAPQGIDLSSVREHLLNCVGTALIFCKPDQALRLQGRSRPIRYLGYMGIAAAIVLALTGWIIREPISEMVAAPDGQPRAKVDFDAGSKSMMSAPAPAFSVAPAVAETYTPPKVPLPATKGRTKPLRPPVSASSAAPTGSAMAAAAPSAATSAASEKPGAAGSASPLAKPQTPSTITKPKP